MKKIKSNLNVIIPLLIILFIGIFMVYSSSSIWANFIYDDTYYYLKRQTIFVIIGLILMFILSKINLKYIRMYNNILLIICFIMLILVIIPGIGVSVNGSRSWFKLGSFLLQPSEIFKIFIVIYMADKLDKYYEVTDKFFKTILILLIPSLLGFVLIMLQPDFGSGIVMIGSTIMMCMLSKNKFKYYIIIFICALLAFSILIIFSPYRSDRIISFINPYVDPLGSGFQTIQSLYAIGPGAILGKGIDTSFQKYFYLPEPQTDFIFAIYAEDFGFIGSVILIILYAYLIKNMLEKAVNEKSIFKAYLDIGIASLIIIQVCINLCVVVGLIPVTGITLPFLSYGGSSITMLLCGVGLILNKGENYEYSNVR